MKAELGRLDYGRCGNNHQEIVRWQTENTAQAWLEPLRPLKLP